MKFIILNLFDSFIFEESADFSAETFLNYSFRTSGWKNDFFFLMNRKLSDIV